MADIKLSEREHPLYGENKDNEAFYQDSAFGGQNMLNETHIFSHRLEESSDHQERIKRGYFLNFCDTIPNIYNSFIFRENIKRAPDQVLLPFRKDTDGKGTPITYFVRKAGYYASIFGAIHVLIDLPSEIKKGKVVSKRDVKDRNLFPYASFVFPTQLIDWSVDANGELLWIVIQYTYYRDEDPAKEREIEEHYKIITREEWWIEDETGEKVTFPDTDSNGTNELGFIPLVTMYHSDINDDKIGESMLKDIAYINRAILNWCSCIDEQIERQTFSQLVIPDDGSMADKEEEGGDPLRAIGTSSYWTFPSDAGQPPQFIAPDTSTISVIWKIVLDHIKEIYRIARLVGGVGDLYVSRSGKAAQVSFQSVNSALSEKASRYEKFENDISETVYTIQNADLEKFEKVKYPSSFDITALGDEIDSYFKVMNGNFSGKLNKIIQKNIARKAVPMASETEKEEVESEIESGDGLITTGIEEDIDIPGEEGNPNVNKLSDTNKSISDKEKEETQKKKKE